MRHNNIFDLRRVYLESHLNIQGTPHGRCHGQTNDGIPTQAAVSATRISLCSTDVSHPQMVFESSQ